MNCKELAEMIDHTNLKPTATVSDIKKLCEEAKKYGFGAVCVNPGYVPLAFNEVKDSSVKVCTVIGFPLGATSTDVKAYETEWAIKAGAEEIDMVINVGAIKSNDWATVEDDISAVVKAAERAEAEQPRKNAVIVKVILETCYLNEDEIREACKRAAVAGADFVKTSTGFGTRGATIEAIRIMKEVVGNSMGIKASGGIRDFVFAKELIEAGATRIGASAGIKLLEECK